jgi:hypothetical protein
MPGYGDAARRAPLDAAGQRWRILLTALINHPDLLDELDERLAAVHPPNVALDKLVQQLHIARSFNLDSKGLRSHLEAEGFADLLAGLLTDQVYAMARGAAPTAQAAEARAICLDALDHLEREAIDIEIEALQARAEQEQSPELVEQLLNAKRLRADMVARAAEAEDEGMRGAAGPAPGVP